MKFQAQTLKVARFCARKKVEAKDVEDVELDLMLTLLRSVGLDLGNQREQLDVEVGMDADGEDGNRTSVLGIPESEHGPKPEASPAPDSPPLLGSSVIAWLFGRASRLGVLL